MILMEGQEFLTAEEACALLGIKIGTLYAYVSRGIIKSYRQGIKRQRLYRREDVLRLTRLHGPDGESEGDGESPPGAGWIPYV